MDRKNITSANREAWEEAAPLHRAQNMERLISAFREPGYSCLDAVETARLRALGVAGKDVAQLCCNNGQELLSVKNLGAARCVGFEQQLRDGFHPVKSLHGDAVKLPRGFGIDQGTVALSGMTAMLRGRRSK